MAQDEYRPSNIFHRVSTVLDRLEGVPERPQTSGYAAASKRNWSECVDMLPDSNVPSSAVMPPQPEPSARPGRGLRKPEEKVPVTSVGEGNVFQKVSTFLEYVEGARPPPATHTSKNTAAWNNSADVLRGHSAAVSVAVQPPKGSSLKAPPSIAVPAASSSGAPTAPRTRGLKQPSQHQLPQPPELPPEQQQQSVASPRSQTPTSTGAYSWPMSGFQTLVQRQYVIRQQSPVQSPVGSTYMRAASPVGSTYASSSCSAQYMIRQQSPVRSSMSPSRSTVVLVQTPQAPPPQAPPPQAPPPTSVVLVPLPQDLSALANSPPASSRGGRSSAGSYYSASKAASSVVSMSVATTATTPSEVAAGRGRRINSEVSPGQGSQSGPKPPSEAGSKKPNGGSRASSEAGPSASQAGSVRAAGSQAGSVQISQMADNASCQDARDAAARDAPVWLAEAEDTAYGSPRWIDKRTASPEAYQPLSSSTRRSFSPKEIDFVSRAAGRDQVTCPKVHPLTPYTTRGGYCDGCSRQVDSGISVMACTSCNWWLCNNCYRGRIASQASALTTLASMNGQDRGRRSTPTRARRGRSRGRVRSQSQSPDAQKRPGSDADFAECGCDGPKYELDEFDGGSKAHRSCCEPPSFEVQEIDPSVYEQQIYEQRLDEQRLYEERLYEERLREQRLCEQRSAEAYARERAGGDTLSRKEEYRVCGGPGDACTLQ